MGQPSYGDLGTTTPDSLIAGDYPMVREEVTVLADEVLSRGAVLGKVTASGKYILCDTAAADGSENPTAILLEDVDATGADTPGIAAFSGEFNENAISLGGATTAADVKDTLRDKNIYLKTAVS